MLKKRIIPCLDVKDGLVVKGIQFQNHKTIGDPIELAKHYAQSGADELVFYDISASAEGRSVDLNWIEDIARVIDIPFCVAGGIRTVKEAADRLEHGADKISINTPAIDNPGLIDDLVQAFGTQCVVVGIDSLQTTEGYRICKNTGHADKMQVLNTKTSDWAKEACDRGAGEIVLNCMNQDGVRQGYDVSQLAHIRKAVSVPLIASGGAGTMDHFRDVFRGANVDGALAASVFHHQDFTIPALKSWLKEKKIEIRL